MTERLFSLPPDYSPTRFAQDMADLDTFEEAGFFVDGSREALLEARKADLNRYRFPEHQIPPLKEENHK